MTRILAGRRRVLALVAALAAGLSATAGRADAASPLPPDLAAVPADAAGFARVRVAEIWKSDLFRDVRATVLRAGETALRPSTGASSPARPTSNNSRCS